MCENVVSFVCGGGSSETSGASFVGARVFEFDGLLVIEVVIVVLLWFDVFGNFVDEGVLVF